MDEPGDNNNNSADTSGRSSGGGRSAADPAVRELVDLHAFLLGLVGDGDGAAGDADQNREDAASFSAAAAAAATPAGRGRSIRAMAERNPEMQPLMNVVLETLNSLQTESSCVTYFREVASSVTAYDEEKVTTVSSKEDPLIRAVMESGAVRDLVRSMGRDDEDDDYEATYALIHYVDAGTEWNIQHAVDEAVLPKFVALLKSPSVGIRKEAARVLGNMTNVSQGARRSWREPLWDCGAIDAMVTLLQQDDDDDVRQYAAEAVGNVCEDQPNEERIRSVAPTLSQLLFYHDEKVLEKVCWALNSCLVYTEALQSRVQTIIRMGVCRRLVELLRDPSPEVQYPVLSSVASILEGDADPQKESILKHRPLPALRDIFLSDDTDLAMYACEAIARILRLGQVHIDAAIQHQIIPCLVALLEVENEDTFVAAVEAIHAAVSNGTTEQIRVLVDYGCLGPLCGCFTSATVKYPSSVVLEVLELLEIILRAGADGRGANPMAAELVEAGGLAKLQVLRQHDDPDAQAAASVILDTYFGAVEEKGIGAGSDSESDASGEADGDDDVGGEPPRQRLRLA